MSLRVVLLGCGRWGSRLAVQLARHPDLDLVAVVDPDLGARTSAAQAVGAGLLAAGSFGEALQLDPQAACIATPPETHAPLAIRALELGLHVLVEKPLARGARAAERMCAAARDSGRVAMLAQVLRYHPAYERLFALAAAGAIGRPRWLCCRRLTQSGSPDPLWTLCSHDLATALGLDPGPVREVAVREEGAAACVELVLSSGLVTRLVASTTASAPLRRVELVGDAGRLVIDELAPHSTLRLVRRAPDDAAGWDAVVALPGAIADRADANPLGRQLAHFAACAATGRRPRTSFEDGARIAAVLERAEQQMVRARPEAVRAASVAGG